jgi:hypothetical protein
LNSCCLSLISAAFIEDKRRNNPPLPTNQLIN